MPDWMLRIPNESGRRTSSEQQQQRNHHIYEPICARNQSQLQVVGFSIVEYIHSSSKLTCSFAQWLVKSAKQKQKKKLSKISFLFDFNKEKKKKRVMGKLLFLYHLEEVRSWLLMSKFKRSNFTKTSKDCMKIRKEKEQQQKLKINLFSLYSLSC